jgi:hypothetical protein
MTPGQRIEMALRGAALAKSALQLLDDGTDDLLLRLICEEVEQKAFELRTAASNIMADRREK